eukprot:2702459-Alexandrium_andersonii.AAC.1
MDRDTSSYRGSVFGHGHNRNALLSHIHTVSMYSARARMCGFVGRARCWLSAGWYTKWYPFGPNDARCPPSRLIHL